MNSFYTDEFIILRVSDYKDNKSIINALSRQGELLSFSVKNFRKYNNQHHGKIAKLNIINATLFKSQNNHYNLSQINTVVFPPKINEISEYQAQQKLNYILEKIANYKVETYFFDLIKKSYAQNTQISDLICPLLAKYSQTLNLFEKNKNLKKANYFFIHANGEIKNSESPHKISLETFKIINYYIKTPIEMCTQLVIDSKHKNEIEKVFCLLLELKYETLINLRNLNDVFNSIQLHNQTN